MGLSVDGRHGDHARLGACGHAVAGGHGHRVVEDLHGSPRAVRRRELRVVVQELVFAFDAGHDAGELPAAVHGGELVLPEVRQGFSW